MQFSWTLKKFADLAFIHRISVDVRKFIQYDSMLVLNESNISGVMFRPINIIYLGLARLSD